MLSNFMAAGMAIALAAVTTGAAAQEVKPQETKSHEIKSPEVKRRIISRSDLTGTNMEVLLVESEYQPGAELPRHTHPGEEAFYVVQGATTQIPGQQQTKRDAGSGGINKRDVPHAGYKVIGDTPLRMVNVYIVDKGKPLMSPAP